MDFRKWCGYGRGVRGNCLVGEKVGVRGLK